MKGSIRLIGGLILVMGAVGGMDTATDLQLLPLLGIAAIGLFAMFSGTEAMKRA